MMRPIVCCLAFAVVGSVAVAEERVAWRTTYDEARKEASEKNLPLLLDFGTDDCVHCKRLDASTFRDTTVVTLLNNRFIPLKIDANREPRLTQALRVQAYPTIILAAHDGKILGILEGYLDAGRMNEQLQRVLTMQMPDWTARDFKEAAKSSQAGEYARAVALLRNIVEESKDSACRAKAQESIDAVEKLAEADHVRAKKLAEEGKNGLAAELYTEIVRKYAGTRTANESARSLAAMDDRSEAMHKVRERRAAELLLQAKDDFRAERFLRCLDHCDMLTGAYRDCPEARDAAMLVGEIQSHPGRMLQVCDSMNQRLSMMYLQLAETFQRQGQDEHAAACLAKVLVVSPNTPQSQSAQVRLTKLQEKPAVRTVPTYTKP